MDRRKELLIKDLQDSDTEIRRLSAEALEKLHVRDRIERLVKVVREGEMLEKVNALYALSDFKGEKIIGLIAAALKDPSEDVRAAAARAMGDVGDLRVLPHLVQLLEDVSPVVLRTAIFVLGKYNDPRLFGPLMPMLKNQDAGVVEKALEVIGKIGDKRAEEAMIFFAVKGNRRMKTLAIKALGTMDR